MRDVIVRLENPTAAAAWIRERAAGGASVGFVPTMGALHAGHITLVERARRENDLVVVSIFVNPLQFEDPADLERYPRDLAGDSELLAAAGCDLCFSGVLLGPAGFFPEFAHRDEIPVEAPGPAARGLEGALRTGHFAGVATIVRRLFETVRPTRAYFGAKDFQQTLVILDLAERMRAADPSSIQDVVICPIDREPGGLARSSRNELLDPWTRHAARALLQSLVAGQDGWSRGERDPAMLVQFMRQVFEAIAPASFELEYLALRDPLAWTEAEPAGGLQRAVALIAVRVPGERGGSVRLIDNLRLDQARSEEAAEESEFEYDGAPFDPRARAWVDLVAPAKLNPSLLVLGRRDDGFHEVDLTMLAIDLVDQLRVTWIDDGVLRDRDELLRSMDLHVFGPAATADVPRDPSNLVCRAAALVLAELEGPAPAGYLRIDLQKFIPSRAGLGGGSSDATAAWVGTLELCAQLDIALSKTALGPDFGAALAALGSDCPFFLTPSGYARCRGRGERITKLERFALDESIFTIVTPGLECPTGTVYAAVESGRRAGTLQVADPAWQNDLEAAALRVVPELAEVRRRLELEGGSWMLAGSGASYFRREDRVPGPELLGDLMADFPDHRYVGAHRAAGHGVVCLSVMVPTRGGPVPILGSFALEEAHS